MIVTTYAVQYVTETWVLVKGNASGDADQYYYAGFRFGLSPAAMTKTQWYNPPGGFTILTGDFTFSANLGSLLPGTTYYFSAQAYDGTTYFYGDTLNFTTTSLPIPVLGTGYRYKSAFKNLQDVAELAVGRVYVDTQGNLIYESRLARLV